MLSTRTDPIRSDWSDALSDHDHAAAAHLASAAEVSARLARLRVSDIEPSWLPNLAASAAELASVAGVPWRFSTDDPAVALLRLIAKVTIMRPDASGPHTARLLAQLP